MLEKSSTHRLTVKPPEDLLQFSLMGSVRHSAEFLQGGSEEKLSCSSCFFARLHFGSTTNLTGSFHGQGGPKGLLQQLKVFLCIDLGGRETLIWQQTPFTSASEFNDVSRFLSPPLWSQMLLRPNPPSASTALCNISVSSCLY